MARSPSHGEGRRGHLECRQVRLRRIIPRTFHNVMPHLMRHPSYPFYVIPAKAGIQVVLWGFRFISIVYRSIFYNIITSKTNPLVISMNLEVQQDLRPVLGK